MSGRIVILSGPPGVGKSTVARGLAEGAEGERAVHLHTDDFYGYIRKGYLPPWRPEAREQNTTIMDALAGCAATYAVGGYEVVVDGVVGPWFFDPWMAVSRQHALDLRYVALTASEAETVARATARTTPGAMTEPEVVRSMWRSFAVDGRAADLVLDTSGQSPAETLARIRVALDDGRFVLNSAPWRRGLGVAPSR